MHNKKEIKLINIVRRNLWSRGYRVKSFVNTELGFDLLIKGKYKVKTTSGLVEKLNDIIVADVSFDAAKRPVIIYHDGIQQASVMPLCFFGLPSTEQKNEKDKKIKKSKDAEKNEKDKKIKKSKDAEKNAKTNNAEKR